MDGCRSCIYVLESGCSLISEAIFIASQREKISGHTNESIVYPLNRAIVKEMVDEALVEGVDKVFKKLHK